MNTSDSLSVPSTAACEIARLSRDSRFDGVFFTAVLSTRIYCRPVCPARAPKAENVVYYPSAAAAQAEGFRPCLRCRPELAPGNPFWQQGEHLVARALKLINEGFLADHSLERLAERLHVSARQVRRLFVQYLGAPPMAVHATQRLLFAKQLLTETPMSITEVAMASGFGSLRRFNAAFAEANHVQPRAFRRSPKASSVMHLWGTPSPSLRRRKPHARKLSRYLKRSRRSWQPWLIARRRATGCTK